MDKHTLNESSMPAAHPAAVALRRRAQVDGVPASLAVSPPAGGPLPQHRSGRNDRRWCKKGGRRQHERADEGSNNQGAKGPPVQAESGRWSGLPEQMVEAMRRLSASPREAEWLTAAQAAAHLGMGVRAFYSAVERGQVPAVRLGRRLRFSRTGLDHLLSPSRSGGLRPRVPSPGKETERW
jgi:excisionase family DNA binding protein